MMIIDDDKLITKQTQSTMQSQKEAGSWGHVGLRSVIHTWVTDKFVLMMIVVVAESARSCAWFLSLGLEGDLPPSSARGARHAMAGEKKKKKNAVVSLQI